MRESAFESIGRFLLGLCAAAALVWLVMAGLRVSPFKTTTTTASTVALESRPAKEEKQRQAYLEEKIGECYSRGGVARLDPLSGYMGCDVPVPKSRPR
jgi:hypothetical protein